MKKKRKINHTIESIKDSFMCIRSYIIMIVACTLLLFARPHVISLLSKLVAWIQPCSHIIFVVLISAFAIALSVVRIYRASQKEQQVAHSTIAFELFIIIFYSYFRIIDDTFIFWGPERCFYRWCDILYLPFILLLVQKICCRNNDNEQKGESVHIMDKPIDDPKDDVFGYDTIACGLLSDLGSVDVQKKSFSIGILGKWGQGKSSFMNLLKLHAKDEGDIIVEFYPRASKSIKNIQEDFFNALKEQLSHFHTGIERYISRYAREVAEVDEGWFGKLALAVSIITKDNEKERINNVIRAIGRRIYVVVEDFDRLTGEEILEVLKLLERNGDFCNTVFVTAYDKQYINEVIAHRLGNKSYQDYTDKYFDHEYPLPVQNQGTLLAFAKDYLAKHIKLLPKDRINQQQLLDALNVNGPFVVSILGTMRHVKRFINIFMSRYPVVRNDVDVSDFLLLTLLRYKDQAAYNAIFDLRFLRRGSFIHSGSPKLVYLQDNYIDTIKALNISAYSTEIIERLFKKKEQLNNMPIDELYGKIVWADEFNRYFYDYRIGKYHYEDFQQLFDDDVNSAFAHIEEMHKDGIDVQLEDFLRSRKESWIIDEKGLERLLSLIIYLDSLNRSFDLEGYIDIMTVKDTYKEYEKAGVVKSETQYHDALLNVLRLMVEKCPMEVGFSCHHVTQALIDGKTTDSELVLSAEELKDLSIWAQRFYYQRYPSGNYIFTAIINLAFVKEKQNGETGIAEEAKCEFVSLMKLYPEQFAKDLVEPTQHNVQKGKGLLTLRFNERFDDHLLLGVDGFSFVDWMSVSLDAKQSYVLHRIYDAGNDFIHVPALKSEYEKGDFDGFYEALKHQEEKEDDDAVIGVIKKRMALDYQIIGEFAGIGINRAKESVRRLVDSGAIDSRYLSLKERMQPYQVGDFVRIVDDKYDSYSKSLYYSDNIFKVVEFTNDGSVKLMDIQSSVPQVDIEAIPIDGVHDRTLYYDPVVAASYVAPGQSAPVHHSHAGEYYMDGLENTKLEGKKTLKSMVEKNNCQFVHEVQHSLRKLFHQDGLKLDHSLK